VYRAVWLQLAATGFLALLAAWVYGLPGAVSAAWGGTAVWFPNCLLAWQMSLYNWYVRRSRKTAGVTGEDTERATLQALAGAGALLLLAGQVFKLLLSVAILGTAALWYRELAWPVFLLTLFVALQGSLLALLIKN